MHKLRFVYMLYIILVFTGAYPIYISCAISFRMLDALKSVVCRVSEDAFMVHLKAVIKFRGKARYHHF